MGRQRSTQRSVVARVAAALTRQRELARQRVLARQRTIARARELARKRANARDRVIIRRRAATRSRALVRHRDLDSITNSTAYNVYDNAATAGDVYQVLTLRGNINKSYTQYNTSVSELKKDYYDKGYKRRQKNGLSKNFKKQENYQKELKELKNAYNDTRKYVESDYYKGKKVSTLENIKHKGRLNVGKGVDKIGSGIEKIGKIPVGKGKTVGGVIVKGGKWFMQSGVGKALKAGGKGLGPLGTVMSGLDIANDFYKGVKDKKNRATHIRRGAVKLGSTIIGAAIGSLLGPGGGTMLGASIGSAIGDGINWLLDRGKGSTENLIKNKEKLHRGAALRFARGGLVTGGPQLATVAEEGTPEMIIPLGAHRKQRGLELWERTGKMLGANGSNFGIEQPKITLPTQNMAQPDIMGTVRENMGELSEEVAGVLNTVISGQYANTPA